MPNESPAKALPRLPLFSAGTQECCGKCRFWFSDSGQQPPASPGNPAPPVIALCRRFPPQIHIVNVPVGGNPRVIDPRTGFNQHAQIGQQPMPFQSATASTDWCGEFSGRVDLQ